jgi:predicted transcriptional regulator
MIKEFSTCERRVLQVLLYFRDYTDKPATINIISELTFFPRKKVEHIVRVLNNKKVIVKNDNNSISIKK